MLQYNILNQHSIAKQLPRKDMIPVLQQKIATKLYENNSYNFYFKNVDYEIRSHIKRIISFMFDNTQIFKSCDLRVIHQGLKITASVFDLFLMIIKGEMKEMGISADLIEKVEKICMYYKDCICSQRESEVTAKYILSQIKK